MLSHTPANRAAWTPWIFAIAGFWLSCNLVLDFLVMPVMYTSGMASQPDFAPTSYSLFWTFNRVELLCAAALLSGILALRRKPLEFSVCQSGSRCRWALAIGVSLLGAAFIDTYLLMPQMSAAAFAMELSPSTALAPVMSGMHSLYWLVELVKLACLGGLAWLCWGDIQQINTAETGMDKLA